MSFFGSLLGDFEDDPFTGHMRQMNRMMNSFFTGSPFGGMMGNSTDLMPFDGRRGAAGAMMPFGFPDMDRMFQGIDQGHAPRGNCHSFTTSTVMTMSNGPDGRPQVYQASQSVRAGPGGVRETKKTVADSRSGVKKMAIGHHIGDRSHILEREQNVHSGEHEEREEFINLDEEEAPDFNREWQNKTRSFSTSNAIGYPSASAVRYSSGGRRHHDNTPMLPPAPSQSTYRSRPRTSTNRRSNYSNSNYPALPPPSSNGNIYHGHVEEAEDDDDDDEADDDDDEEGGVSIVELEDDEDCEPVEDGNKQESTHQKKDKPNESSRKREHEPDVQYKSKIQKLHRDSNVSK